MSAQDLVSAEEAQAMAEACERDAAFAEETAARMTGVLAVADAVEAWRDSAAGLRRTARALRTVIALRAVIAGRTTPPTDEELDVHAQRSSGGAGVWLIVTARGPVIDVVTLPESRAWHMERGAARWTPMLDGRPCAWPEANPVPVSEHA